MIDFKTSRGNQRQGEAATRRLAVADIAVELTVGGTRIPLPTVPYLPVEPLRAARSPSRPGAARPDAAAGVAGW